jgi:hypothetical protein
MDASTISSPTLPNASLHSTANNFSGSLHPCESQHNNLARGDGACPVELSEAEMEMGLILLKKQTELVRLEIQQLELELAIQQARRGNRELLVSWQKKHGTPWNRATESNSAIASPGHTSSSAPSTPQHGPPTPQPHNVEASALQNKSTQDWPIQDSEVQGIASQGRAPQGSVQPVLYTLLSNFSKVAASSTHPNVANASIIIRHPLMPGYHSHPNASSVDTRHADIASRQNPFNENAFESPPSLVLTPYTTPASHNAIAYQIHSPFNLPIAESAPENNAEPLLGHPIGSHPSSSQIPSSSSPRFSATPSSLFSAPSQTYRRDQTPHDSSPQPNETTSQNSPTANATQIPETRLPESSSSLTTALTTKELTGEQLSASPSRESSTSAAPREPEQSAAQPTDLASLTQPQVNKTKTTSPKDSKALDSQLQPARSQSPQSLPSRSSPAAPSLRAPTAKSQTARSTQNQRGGKKRLKKSSSSGALQRITDSSNAAALSRKKTPSWVTSIAIHTAGILGLMAVTLKIPEVNAPFALTAFIEPADSLAVEASPMETTTTLEATSENETLAEAMQSDLLQPETALAQNDLQSAIATTTTALKPIISDQASAGATSLGDKLAAGLVGAGAGGMQTTAEVQSLSKASFFGVQASGNIFCYVVDNSGSMRGEPFEATKKELLRSISLLKSNQRFYVLFFNQQLSPMRLFGEEQVPQTTDAINPRAPAQATPPSAAISVTEPSDSTTLVPAAAYANPENLLRLQRWIETVSIGSGGPPNQALKMAIELQPDSIFLLTDGVTRSDVTGFLRKNNRREDSLDGTQLRCQINTIGFYSREGETLLQRIASENGGQYLYVPNPRDSQKP